MPSDDLSEHERGSGLGMFPMRGRLEAHCSGFGFRAVRVEKPGFQVNRAVRRFRAQVHGEFQFPGHGFNETGGADFLAFPVGEGELQMWPLFEGTHLDVDAHAPAVFIRLGGQGDDPGLLGRCTLQVVFGKEKFHERDYTLSPGAVPPPFSPIYKA